MPLAAGTSIEITLVLSDRSSQISTPATDRNYFDVSSRAACGRCTQNPRMRRAGILKPPVDGEACYPQLYPLAMARARTTGSKPTVLLGCDSGSLMRLCDFQPFWGTFGRLRYLWRQPARQDTISVDDEPTEFRVAITQVNIPAAPPASIDLNGYLSCGTDTQYQSSKLHGVFQSVAGNHLHR